MKKILLGILAIFGLALTLGSEDAFKTTLATSESNVQSNGETIELAYVQWDSEVASTYVIAEVLRQDGFTVNLTPLDNAIMWSAVASGEADAMVSAWLPDTHGPQYDQYGDQMVHVGGNMQGAKTGLVVPTYMEDVNSIEDLTDQAGQTITGIEPGAGMMSATEEVLEVYPNLEGWELLAASTGAMTTALDQAYNAGEEIVVTGWSPHWKFQKYDLKYLEDPKGVFGEEESIHTFAREGLKEDQPRAYQILERFHWDLEDMESVMVALSEGTSPEQAAHDWIEANPDKVNAWLAE